MLSKTSVTLTFEERKKRQHGYHEICEYEFRSSNKTIDHLKNISYEKFFTDYLNKNIPCIISLENVKTWRSSIDWVVDGRPNFDFLKQMFGSCVVPVADCNLREYNSQKKKSMSFADYIEYWCSLKVDKKSELLYLKDWHFKRKYPDCNAYETPEYFTSDWLNEFCENQEDDYQFVYMGPKGTWTPLHSDVFGSYSWSVNVCGRKKWLLFPPGNENFLRDESKQVVYMADENYVDENGIFCFKIIQEAGEIIFVPSGWYHQVWNLEDTISINHNWFNGCNIEHVWKCLHQAAVDVENEITDIKEFEGWEDQWQIILKAHHGMNYADFLLILQFIVNSRIEKMKLQNNTNLHWHFVHDLLSVKILCSKILNYQIPNAFSESINNLYLDIKDFLCKTNDIKDLTLIEE